MITSGQEKMALYYAIGRATTQWAHVEYGVGLVAVTCLQSPDISKGLKAFRAIENFRSKLAYANVAVINSPFVSTIGQDWARLQVLVQSLAALRNRMVHDQMIGYLEASEGRRIVLVNKDDRMPSARGAPPSSALGATGIHQAAVQFAKASAALTDLVDMALGREPLHGAEFQKEQPALQLAQIVRQMREAIQPPPQP